MLWNTLKTTHTLSKMWCTIRNTILSCVWHQSSITTVNIRMKPTNGVLSDEAEHTQGSNMGSTYQFPSAKCQTRNVEEIHNDGHKSMQMRHSESWQLHLVLAQGLQWFRYVALDAMRPKGQPALQKFYNTSSLVPGISHELWLVGCCKLWLDLETWSWST
jgi:hypothetical protein